LCGSVYGPLHKVLVPRSSMKAMLQNHTRALLGSFPSARRKKGGKEKGNEQLTSTYNKKVRSHRSNVGVPCGSVRLKR